MTETSNFHIAVVGGGPGGYAAAFLAADLGLKVTLIDPEVNPGGVCLYRGCIPSKQRKVEYIQGRAAFENSNTLRISKAGGADQNLTFDRIILATGSRPAI